MQRLNDVEAALGHVILEVDDDRVHIAGCHPLLHILDVGPVRGHTGARHKRPPVHENLGCDAKL